ncbi:nucleolar complex-associated protein 3 [Annulohypoxylon maeteangense]|uniref:nucleolar complex-associated protein 3 n=1 Tax=Annulohypoxylon maeteangense TaxID=1927788 RepID=UPI002007BCB2|nr:nucleolar complex-associated protein 3 [Annulohypoxylon maeteangense]KAI0887256.1 nucleolar complex-associated protein 3 [Annulohypoxylon maeteangense]
MASRPTKKRKLTPPQSDDEGSSRKSSAKIQKSFLSNAANWDLEQDYETKARKGKKEKESTRLPLKLQDGRVQHVSAPAVDFGSLESDDDWLEGGDESESEEVRVKQPEKPDIPEHQQIREAKEELAKIALLLNETPEENGGAFKALARIGQSRIPAIQKLTLATQLAVYKDVIPGYRIRPVAEDAPEEKLSKDVRRVRTFENSLISGYQAYVKDLTRHAKAGRHHAGVGKGQSVASVAIMCACTLLTAVPHFNFRGDLIKILVGKLSNRHIDDDFNKCLQTLETLFKEDEDGSPSMEAVSLLSKMMRAKEYDVHESVVNLFLHLRLLSEFSHKASKDSVDRSDSTAAPKKPKSKRDFRTKRERKHIKEQKSLQKDMAQADAVVSYEERERKEGETLKLVFGTYFRILKLRVPNLMGAVLEGLSKYAHLINQNFFGDLLEALKDLIRHSEASEDDAEGEDEKGDDDADETGPVRNPSREALLCTTTAFALLAGQDAHNARADLHLDLSFFTTHLYQTLFPLSLNPDLELGARSLHLPDPDKPSTYPTATTARNKVNLQTTTVLLIRCLTAILLPSWNIRSVPPLRIAAFAKQLCTSSLHMPEKSAQAMLALLSDVASTHGRKIGALWNTEERKGDGRFNPLSEGVEASNPFATTVWEGEILRRHYCPKVREGVRLVEKSLARATER